MTASWVGTQDEVASILEHLNADTENGKFKLSGPPVLPLFGQIDGSTWIQIEPDTLCYLNGLAIPVVDLLESNKHLQAVLSTTVGLPVAKRVNSI